MVAPVCPPAGGGAVVGSGRFGVEAETGADSGASLSLSLSAASAASRANCWRAAAGS
ncbi:hypothetical protein MUG78_17145 [Gordonia alkaliphila]|uniref:hypothetical protein n=1 Tax=Gordonia alkaliphila TaxID=1053547 RepID=UPI001FF5BF58|nr:hypothetical protein [Gordonia alkaliphila]MCK0441128.1 hypothetical protein [Gordonia alkaliphila]